MSHWERQTCEIEELYQRSQTRVCTSAFDQRFIQGQKIFRWFRQTRKIIQFLTDECPSSFQTSLSPNLIDQDSADRDGGCREEMSATISRFRILAAKEPQIGFMHKCSRLQSLPIS